MVDLAQTARNRTFKHVTAKLQFKETLKTREGRQTLANLNRKDPIKPVVPKGQNSQIIAIAYIGRNWSIKAAQSPYLPWNMAFNKIIGQEKNLKILKITYFRRDAPSYMTPQSFWNFPFKFVSINIKNFKLQKTLENLWCNDSFKIVLRGDKHSKVLAITESKRKRSRKCIPMNPKIRDCAGRKFNFGRENISLGTAPLK
ncbi:hypothetical protein NC652_028901 [Populus alba x Populus x berolinensis]|nr:hypothetical protein NC652_028901 [Populus alba x Populus x berolinensis]